MNKFRVGNAPVSFGVFEASMGLDYPWPYSRVLDAIGSAGYEGTELGPYGFMPTDAEALRRELETRGLALASSFIPIALDDPSRIEERMEEVLQVGRLLKPLGVNEVIIADATHPERAKVAGRVPRDGSLSWSDRQWLMVGGNINYIAHSLLAELSMRLVVHHHGGTHIETPQEIEELMDSTDPQVVGLLLDTGHAVYGGGDPLEMMALHGSRIRYLHFKDVNAQALAQAREEKLTMDDAWRRGLFCPLGQGCVDFPGLVREARRQDYSGWIIVEQDIVADESGELHPSPEESAIASRRYLADTVGI